MVTLVRKMETLRASIKKSTVSTNREEEKKETITPEKSIPETKNQNPDTIVITKILKNDNRNSNNNALKDAIADIKTPVTVLKRGETLIHSEVLTVNENKAETSSDSGDKSLVVDDKSIDELYVYFN